MSSFCRTTDQLREANQALKDANRELADLRLLRAQLEAERDNLAAALKDTEDALRDAEAKLANAQAALNQLRQDMEARLREKDEEIENIRCVGMPPHVRACVCEDVIVVRKIFILKFFIF